MHYLPLTISQVSLNIKGQALIDNISFSITQPGVYSIIGHNGSGKTLLLNLLAGLVKPSSGSITWQQQPIAPSLTWLPTQPVLLKRSVIDNITSILLSPKKERHKQASEALEWADISHLSTRIATELSTGEQQQVAIARAKAVDADILLIDELYANLDPIAQARVEQLIEKFKADNKLLIITGHHASQLQTVADCTLTLEGGKLQGIQAAAK